MGGGGKTLVGDYPRGLLQGQIKRTRINSAIAQITSPLEGMRVMLTAVIAVAIQDAIGSCFPLDAEKKMSAQLSADAWNYLESAHFKHTLEIVGMGEIDAAAFVKELREMKEEADSK